MAKKLSQLRSGTRGASVIEYTVLLGLLGAVSIGAVFAFGLNVQDNTQDIQSRVDSVAALASGAAPGDGASGGSGGTGTGGGTTTPPPPPPVDVFASCETGFGPNPAAVRGNGDGSLLSGGNDSQIIYALADALVDGGEGGGDFDILMVPGTGAVATFDTVNPETGRVDLPGGGAVVFSNIESVYLCDEGGEAEPPPPPVPVALSWRGLGPSGSNLEGGFVAALGGGYTAAVSYSETSVSQIFAVSTILGYVAAGEAFHPQSWGQIGGVASTGTGTVNTIFSAPVEDLTFRVVDLDASASTWQDRVVVQGFAADGSPIAPTISTSSSLITVAGNTAQGGTNGATASEASGSVLVAFSTPVARVVLTVSNLRVGANSSLWVSDMVGEVQP